MKSITVSILLMLFSLSVYADCPVTTVTTPDSEYYLTTECSLKAQASSFGYIRFWLPTNPSLNDQFTFEEAGASVTEHYEYFDELEQVLVSGDSTYTGGMGIMSTVHQIDGCNELWAAAPGYKVRLTFDGSQWVSEEL